MSFSRTPSGLAAEYLFYKKVLVYVEGRTDFPFYEEILRNYNYYLKAQGGKEKSKKLADDLMGKDLPYVVVLDGDYRILESTRSKHRRVVLLHRYSFENYLFEEGPIKQFCRDQMSPANRLEQLTDNFNAIQEELNQKFEELIILDVTHQRADTGFDVLPEKPHRFFKKGKNGNFEDSQIEQYTEAAKNVNKQDIDEATVLVKQFLKQRRFIDLLPGHFAFGIIRRLIVRTVGKNISNKDIRIYLSRVVWGIVNSHDHNSLKRRLRSAVREAEKIR